MWHARCFTQGMGVRQTLTKEVSMHTAWVRGGLTAVTGLAIMLAGTVAMADPITFSINEPGGGVINGVQYIDFSYQSTLNQTGGSFTESGRGYFGSYRASLGGAPIASGLGSAYNLYADFSGGGTATALSGGGTRFQYSSFDMSMWLDADKNLATANTLVGQSTQLVNGEGHLFPGLSKGDWNLVLKFNPVGGFLSGPFTLGLTLADFNGNITTNDNGVITGSGNLSYSVVPEPASLLLLGSGLAGLGLLRRRMQS